MKTSNKDVSGILTEIAEYLEMQGEAFKPRAYEKAASAIENLDEELGDLYAEGGIKALEEIPGVGASIAEKIEELLKTGKLKYYESLKKKIPVDLSALTKIEGLGPKSVKKLYEKLGVKDLASLEKAARSGTIAGLEGFGKKTEENIVKGIEFVKKSSGRFILGHTFPEIRAIEERLRSLPGVAKLIVAGSVRRRKETIGDIDILAVSKDPDSVMEHFTKMPGVVRVYAKGDTKSAIKIKSGIDVDLRVVPEASYGAALNYFTGSKDHNVALRKIAMQKGYTLNEYGLFSVRGGKGKKPVAGKTEEEIYKALGMDYIEPEMREMNGEIELAKKGTLPKLIGYGDLRGDLQVQTDWTDGAESIESMARVAADLGLGYIAITDHTKRLAMTGGLDEKKIKKQWLEIDRVNKALRAGGVTLKVLKGTECDILKDGTLDLPDEILSQLDIVGVSVHSYFNLSREEQTERVKKAMQNPHADILFHPTGRLIGRRAAYEVDMDELIKTAEKTGTVMEVDAYPDRLDLKDDHIRKAVAAGVKLAIDSDAHSSGHFLFLEHGIAQARRGWARKENVINAWPLETMLKFIKKS